MVLVREIGASVYFMELYRYDETIPLGALARRDDGSYETTGEVGEAIVRFSEGACSFVNPENGEALLLLKLFGGEGDIDGSYVLAMPEDEAMGLMVAYEQNGTPTAALEGWNLVGSAHSTERSDDRYTLEDDDTTVLFAFAADACRMVAEGVLVLLRKTAALEDRWVPGEGSMGAIPDLSVSRTVDPSPSARSAAREMRIDRRKTQEVALDGLRPVSISPDGTRIFAVGGWGVAIYDVRSRDVVFELPLENAPIDCPTVRWAPDGSKVAFTEDHFRLAMDADIHVVYVDTGLHENLTDDGVVRFDPASGMVRVDILPVWAGNGEQLVFLRRGGRESRGPHLQRYDLSSGSCEAISSSLIGYPFINGLFMDAGSGRIYFTHPSKAPDDPLGGVWVLDPREYRPVKVYGNSVSRSGRAYVTDLSVDGEYLMLHFPEVTQGRVDDQAALAFSLYRVPSEMAVPILGSTDPGPAIINNAVFSPDGGKVLFVYGSRGRPERHLAVTDVGSNESHTLFGVEDGTAGVSPLISGLTGIVGLDWCSDDTLYVAVDAGTRVLLLRP